MVKHGETTFDYLINYVAFLKTQILWVKTLVPMVRKFAKELVTSRHTLGVGEIPIGIFLNPYSINAPVNPH